MQLFGAQHRTGDQRIFTEFEWKRKVVLEAENLPPDLDFLFPSPALITPLNRSGP